MQIKLKSGAVIEARERKDDFDFEVIIRTVDGKEIAVKMDADEFKWFALDVHKISAKII